MHAIKRDCHCWRRDYGCNFLADNVVSINSREPIAKSSLESELEVAQASDDQLVLALEILDSPSDTDSQREIR